MTEAAGLFTFPETGYWTVSVQVTACSDTLADVNSTIWYTDDNAVSFTAANRGKQPTENGKLGTMTQTGMFVITDVADQKVKFSVYARNNCNVEGDTDTVTTGFNFIRIAE